MQTLAKEPTMEPRRNTAMRIKLPGIARPRTLHPVLLFVLFLGFADVCHSGGKLAKLLVHHLHVY